MPFVILRESRWTTEESNQRMNLRDSSPAFGGVRITINATAIPKGVDKSSTYQGRGSIYRTLIGITIIKNKESFSNKNYRGTLLRAPTLKINVGDEPRRHKIQK